MEVFLDIQDKLTSDPVFIGKASALMTDLQRAYSSGDKPATNKAILDILRLCEYNTSLIVPFMFPRYPFNKPMTLWNRPHAMSMLSYVPNATITVCTGRQTGKCVTGDTTLECSVDGLRRTVTAKELFDAAASAH